MSYFCEHCGANGSEDARFCANCGQPIEAEASPKERASEPTPPMQGTVKGRPFGIVIIVIITAVCAGFHFFFPLFSSKMLSIFAFAAIYGFWTYQKWGYISIIIVYILQIALLAYIGYYDISEYGVGRYEIRHTSIKLLFVGLLVGVLVGGPIIYYLTIHRIKSIFYRETKSK